MQLGSMFISNCNIALHVSDAFCVHLQEHLEVVEAASGEWHAARYKANINDRATLATSQPVLYTVWLSVDAIDLRRLVGYLNPSISNINIFTAIVGLSRFNNSCLKSPTSTLDDLTFQSRSLRSFSLNQLRNLSL